MSKIPASYQSACDLHHAKIVVERQHAELTEARAEISRLESIITDFWTQAEKTNSAFNFYLRKERDTWRMDYSALREKHDKLSAENAALLSAVDHGRYLSTAAADYIEAANAADLAQTVVDDEEIGTEGTDAELELEGCIESRTEHYLGLKTAIYEFDKRVPARAQAEKEG